MKKPPKYKDQKYIFANIFLLPEIRSLRKSSNQIGDFYIVPYNFYFIFKVPLELLKGQYQIELNVNRRTSTQKLKFIILSRLQVKTLKNFQSLIGMNIPPDLKVLKSVQVIVLLAFSYQKLKILNSICASSPNERISLM